jgi:hypothetical protein
MHIFLPRRTETSAHFSRGELKHGWISPREKLDMRVCLRFPRGKSTPVPFLPGRKSALVGFLPGGSEHMFQFSRGEMPILMSQMGLHDKRIVTY